MRKVKEIVYLEKEERASDYSLGIKFIFEDDSTLEMMSTDCIANKLIEKCIVCGEMGHKTCDNYPI